jgi:hypothetical protein
MTAYIFSRQVEKRFKDQYESQKANNSFQHPSRMYRLLSDFQFLFSKKPASTFKDLFGYQLRQINGVSVSTANALMNKFGTTAKFMQYLRSTDRVNAEVTLPFLLTLS